MVVGDFGVPIFLSRGRLRRDAGPLECRALMRGNREGAVLPGESVAATQRVIRTCWSDAGLARTRLEHSPRTTVKFDPCLADLVDKAARLRDSVGDRAGRGGMPRVWQAIIPDDVRTSEVEISARGWVRTTPGRQAVQVGEAVGSRRDSRYGNISARRCRARDRGTSWGHLSAVALVGH